MAVRYLVQSTYPGHVAGPMVLTLLLDEWLRLGSWASLPWVFIALVSVVLVPVTRTRR